LRRCDFIRKFGARFERWARGRGMVGCAHPRVQIVQRRRIYFSAATTAAEVAAERLGLRGLWRR
jgi:hypothetical protein